MRRIFALLTALCLLLGAAQAETPAGGWNTAEDTMVDEERAAVFERATESLLGVRYEPVAYLASQVVAGVNHCFLCRAAVVYPDAQPVYKLIYIYEDLQGTASVTRIADLDIAELSRGEREITPMPMHRALSELAGCTVTAIPGEYDGEMLPLTILEPETFAAEDIEDLRPGDVIIAGGRAYTVETAFLSADGCSVNDGDDREDSLWLRKDEDGNYRPMAYEDFFWRQVGQASYPLPEGLRFLDGIDPKTGEPLDEPTSHSAQEFLRMMETEENRQGGFAGPGFSSCNFRVTFGEKGELVLLERIYVPWQ